MAGECEKGVVLLDSWSSAYAMRVKIALVKKGVEFVCKQENLSNKSSLLMEVNPIHKKIPVLVHNGKPISESLVIVQYIDEVWTASAPLLPADSYQRFQARFWGDFIDNKIYACARLWRTKGEEQAKLRNEFIEGLKRLEKELKEKKFFGGDMFGYVDIALLPLTSWFYALEKCGNLSVQSECPKIVAWTERCKQRPSVSSSLANPEKIYEYVLDLKRELGIY